MKLLILLLLPFTLWAQTITKVNDSTYQITVKPVIIEKTDTVWLPSPGEPTPGKLIYSINSGGPKDRGFSGGATFSRGTLKAPYNTERWGNLSYNLPANGRYEVVLKFAEIFHTAANRRRFNVSVENQLIKQGWDIFAEAGTDTVVIRHQATVIDGQLTISLQGVLDNAKISGFDVIRLDSIPFNTGGQIPDIKRITSFAQISGPGDYFLEAGFYTESQIKLPAGVNLYSDAAIVVGTMNTPASAWYPSSGLYGFERALMILEGSGENIIEGLTFDGDSKRVRLGIFVKGRKLTLRKSTFRNFNWVGVQLIGAHGSIVEDNIFRNCAYSQDSGSSACLQWSGGDNMIIRGNDFDESMGYASKWAGQYDAGEPSHDGIFENNRCSVTRVSLWKGGTPNIAAEFWQANMRGWIFRNNYFDAVVSLVLTRPWFQDHPPLRIRFENNTFDLVTRSLNYGYCVEIGMSNVEFVENEFIGGSAAFTWTGMFTTRNITVHNNKFTGQVSEGLNIRGQVDGIKFMNNTFDLRGILFRCQTQVSGAFVRNLSATNNTFVNPKTLQQGLTAPVFENNVFL